MTAAPACGFDEGDVARSIPARLHDRPVPDRSKEIARLLNQLLGRSDRVGQGLGRLDQLVKGGRRRFRPRGSSSACVIVQ
jgi:hypothetical protein